MDSNVWIILGAIVCIAIIAKLIRKKKPTAEEAGMTLTHKPTGEEIHIPAVSKYETEVNIEKLEEPAPKLDELTSPDSDKPFAKLKMAESGKAETADPAPSENPSSETLAPKPKRVYKKRTPKPKPPTGDKA